MAAILLPYRCLVKTTITWHVMNENVIDLLQTKINLVCFQSGLSCLHIAAAMGHSETVKILCENRANYDQQFRFEEQDVTAYDLAESQQHDHVCEVLRSFGARQLPINNTSSHAETNKS
jgi:ankyrin repeat protein